tara:strand:+ start:5123 stop:5788 length:666 start_codon:yes stop_codon:yes gene_type:complete
MIKQLTIENILEQAKKVLVSNGKHIPQIIGVNKEGKMLIIVFPFNEESREIALQSVRKFVVENNIVRYFTIIEGWLTEQKIDDGAKPYIQPSLNVDRKECLVVTEYSKFNNPRGITVIFKRDINNKVVEFSEPVSSDNHQTVWNVFNNLKEIRENQNKRIDSSNEQFIKNIIKQTIRKNREKLKKVKSEEEFKKIVAEHIEEIQSSIDDYKRKHTLEDIHK